MTRDAIEQLVRDLSRQLQALGAELGEKADRIAGAGGARDGDAGPADILTQCRQVREHRRRRQAYLPAELFHEPAWDMLLALYVARAEGRTMYVKTLVLAADAPITTSQRWIEQLARLQLVVRTEDPGDRRRIEVTLSERGADAITAYLTEITAGAGI